MVQVTAVNRVPSLDQELPHVLGLAKSQKIENKKFKKILNDSKYVRECAV